MSEENISDVIWATKEEDKKLFPDRIWFKVYYIVYPLSVWFAKRGVKPNNITLLMLPSALIAASLFYCGNIITTVVGAFVIQLFQIFDYSDGKVARATNQKSKYGKELDFLMHVVCHPIVFLSFSGLLFMTSSLDRHFIWIIVMSGAIVECSIRSLKNLVDAMDSKCISNTTSSYQSRNTFLFVVDSIFNGIISFPCFMSILPFVAIIDSVFKFDFSLTLIFVLIQVSYNFLYLLRMVLSVLRRCLKG